MKKADEMDRSIRLRSEEIGFKIAVLALAAWTLFECWRKLTGNAGVDFGGDFMRARVFGAGHETKNDCR